jgi:ribosome-associated protein
MPPEIVHFDVDSLTITVNPPGKPPFAITPKDLQLSYYSSGSGGQHANKTENGVQAIWTIPENYQREDVASTTRQLISRNINERSLLQNKRAAMQDLAQKIADYFHVDAKRIDTKPTKGSRRRRVAAKKQHAVTKSLRRSVKREEW